MRLANLVVGVGLLVSSSFVTKTAAQTCSTTTVAASYPTDTATPVSLHEYAYCGGTLNVSVFIAVDLHGYSTKGFVRLNAT